jgi:uncharacterized protein YdeI (YjbR/CyaY-like superfamily)
MEPIYFSSPAEFRAWLEVHHETETELEVGFYRKASGVPSMTWSEAVDEALCFGWIDGVRHSVDDRRYRNRYTPRRRGSTWSVVNVRKVAALTEQGRMRPAGLRAFEARTDAKTGVYSFEQPKDPRFTPEQARRFRAEPDAWAFFSTTPPSYRRPATWWVISAKQEATRDRRFTKLIEDSRAGRRLKHLTSPSKRSPERT